MDADHILIYCENDNMRLKLTKGKDVAYYRCPMYEKENRNIGTKACMTRLSLWDHKALCDELLYLEEEEGLHRGMEGKIKHIHYKIVEVEDRFIKVQVKTERKREK